MLAKLSTFPLVGIDAVPVKVEVDASRWPAENRFGWASPALARKPVAVALTNRLTDGR